MQTNKSILLSALLWLLAPAAAHATDTVFINLANPTSGDGYIFADHVLTIEAPGPYVLTGSTSENRVVIAPSVIATITLRNASITSATHSPFALDPDNCTVVLHIEGKDTLNCTVPDSFESGHLFYAGLQVEGTANLTIDGTGSLVANGGVCAAGIGGGWTQNGAAHPTGNITINGGAITARGGIEGAGIGGGSEGASGIIVINGGVVLAIGGEYFGDPAAIGAGGLGYNNSISITGGSVFAYGGNGVGIGRSSDGTISITGGTVVADEIGTWSGGGILTTLSGSGTAIIASDINVLATDYNNAQVQTGVSLSLEVMQAMANNTPYGLTLHDTLLLHDTLPADTTRDTISVHDTIYSDTTELRDTIYLDTTEIHDTVHIDTVNIYDTLHVDSAFLHDTLHADTTEVHDTTLIIDTIHTPVSVPDTTRFPVSIYDTTRTSAIVIDPALPPETLSITDTLLYDRPVDAPTYVLLEDDGSTDAQTLVNAPALRVVDSEGGIILEGLTAGEAFAVHSVGGLLIVHATAPASGTYLLRNLAKGTYLLSHAGRWEMFTRK